MHMKFCSSHPPTNYSPHGCSPQVITHQTVLDLLGTAQPCCCLLCFTCSSLPNYLTLLVQSATSVWFNTSLSVNIFLSEPIREALEISSFLLILHSSLFVCFCFAFSHHLLHWCCYTPLSFLCRTMPHFSNSLLMTASVFFIQMRKGGKNRSKWLFKCWTKKALCFLV